MRILIILTLFLSAPLVGVQGQSAESNDPKAKAILDELRANLESNSGLIIDFTLQIEFPNEPIQTMTGKLSQKAEAYRLSLGDQLFISDGEDLWLYQKEPNEVQINDIDPEAEGFNSPRDFINIYEREDYQFILTDDGSGNPGNAYKIDFKPLDSNAEYFKIRLTVSTDKQSIDQVKVFEKDGSRYTVFVSSIDRTPSFPAGYFTFDPSKYPGVFVEDLRLD